MTSAFDYVVLVNKAINQVFTAEQIAPAVDEDRTTLVIIQNGVGNEEPFRKRYPKATIISCVVSSLCSMGAHFPLGTDEFAVLVADRKTQTWTGATQPEPGVVRHLEWEDMQLGLYPSSHPDANVSLEAQQLATFADLLTKGGTKFQVVPDIQKHRWDKVVSNAAWSSLTTLTGVESHAWMASSPAAIPMTKRLMTEVVSVAQKVGVATEYALVDRLMEKFQVMPSVGSSMLTDYKNGKPMEVEVILGYPAKKARELGVSTPILETLYVILTAVNEKLLRESAQ